MRIKKEMLSEGLQPYYGPMMAYARVLGKPWGIRLMLLMARLSRGRDVDGLACEQRSIPSRSGGRDIRIRIYKPLMTTEPLPGLLYLHGGGYMISAPEDYGAAYTRLIEAAPSVIVAPDYRKAFEAPYPAALDDCYDTLLWMRDHADELGIIPDRLAVAGHSAGGGLTAAVSLKARDTGDVHIAFQAPIYPMIDDKQTTFSSQFEAPVWGAASNRLGWESYLRGLHEEGSDIPAYAAPARTTDYSKLPPTITYVGSVDPFRDEVQTYVEGLRSAGVPVAFELFEGAFHGFEITAPESGVGQAAWAFLTAQYSAYVARYFDDLGMVSKNKRIVAEGYNRMARRYLDWAAGVRVDERERYTRLLLDRLPVGAEVLELGCGAGLPTTKRLARKFHVTGVDISEGQIEMARENVPGARFFVADMTRLDFEPGTFDAVTAFYSMTHVPRTEHADMLRSIFRLLKPGGLLAASMGVHETDGVEADWLSVPMLFSHWDAETNRKLIEEAGFRLISAEVETAVEEGMDISFLWVVAEKPL